MARRKNSLFDDLLTLAMVAGFLYFLWLFIKWTAIAMFWFMYGMFLFLRWAVISASDGISRLIENRSQNSDRNLTPRQLPRKAAFFDYDADADYDFDYDPANNPDYDQSRDTPW